MSSKTKETKKTKRRKETKINKGFSHIRGKDNSMIKLLVVDDDKNLCRPIKKFFQRKKYSVETVHSGKKALECIEKTRPHLVFLDIGLPDISGLKVLEKIKEIDKTIKVIMITAYDSMDKIKQARKLGISEYINKPFSINYLQKEGVAKVQRQLFEELRREHRKELEIRKLFQQYVPHYVVKEIIEKRNNMLQGAQKNVTVLICDIRDSSQLTKKFPPEEVVEILNDYFTTMVKPIYANKGIVDKFLGDGIMGLFGAPVSDKNNAKHAVNAARAMIKKLKRFNNKNKKRYGELVVGIAINTGDVVAGNIGCDQKIEYTVIGDAVNIAAKIESCCKPHPNSILLSSSTYSRVKKDVKAEKLGKIIPRRKNIDIYKLK